MLTVPSEEPVARSSGSTATQLIDPVCSDRT